MHISVNARVESSTDGEFGYLFWLASAVIPRDNIRLKQIHLLPGLEDGDIVPYVRARS